MIACTTCGARPPLCDACVSATVAAMRGHARARGMSWAMAVAERVSPSSRPWPAYEGRAAAIARAKVADLARDERVLEEMAVEAYEDARRFWNRQRG